jgi:hypothetical protein
MSTAMEEEGSRTVAEETYATRTREEEMVQELLKDWRKGRMGKYYPWKRRRMLSDWVVKMLIA